jgi:uncharacterized membrane protein
MPETPDQPGASAPSSAKRRRESEETTPVTMSFAAAHYPDPTPDIPDTALPHHIEQTIQAIAKLHADHERTATRPQRAVGRIVAVLGSPTFLTALFAAVAAWIAANLLAQLAGHRPIDPPPFAWLELAASLSALCITILILATQRHDDLIGQQREQMTLQFAILSERKLAKIIDLLEESRRDNPLLEDRIDHAADAMATPADKELLGKATKPSASNKHADIQ